MAKKETEHRYMSCAVPSGESAYEMIRWRFGGINVRDRIDTGEFTDLFGISSEVDYMETDPPFVVNPMVSGIYANPIQIEKFDRFILVLYLNAGGALMGDMIVEGLPITTVTISADNDYGAQKRSVVLFNVCEMEDDNIVAATFKPTLLVFPDRKSFPATPTVGGSMTAYDLGDTYPNLIVGTSFQGRVFGADGERVYASEYNDYAGWELDTADASSASNAWVTVTQTNVRADDVITGITVYNSHVVVFKKGYMHMVYGTENPFRLVDVGERGAVGSRAFAEVGGILYFASSGGIMAYDGSDIVCISRNVIDADEEMDADTILTGDARYLYVNNADIALRYDTTYGLWTRQSLPMGLSEKMVRDISANNASSHDVCILGTDGVVYAPDAETGGRWHAETDMMCLSKMDIRRIKKIEIMGEFDGSGSAEGDRNYIRVFLLKTGEIFDAGRSRLIAKKEFGGGKSYFALRSMIRMSSDTGHRLYIEGNGSCRITSIRMKISYGGDLYGTA